MAEMMVQVEHVSMDFRMDMNRTTNFKEWVVNALKGKQKIENFHALDDVTFHVEKGEVLGLIGRNGAGKSTMLKVISGIYKPTSGVARTQGRVVPLLELGCGFDAELTGRENILLNGAILGVGDERFQRKSHARMMELMSGGTTVLFVSHSLPQIRQMCDHVVWLDHGKVRAFGPTDEVCDQYAADMA